MAMSYGMVCRIAQQCNIWLLLKFRMLQFYILNLNYDNFACQIKIPNMESDSIDFVGR